jgi:hypothetical protein
VRFAAHALHPSSALASGPDPFSAAEVRDLRTALDLYCREHGDFPARLQDLVEDRWLTEEQVHPSGCTIDYHRERAGVDYHLEIKLDH